HQVPPADERKTRVYRAKSAHQQLWGFVNSGVSLYSDFVRVRRLSLAAAIVVLGALVFTTGAQPCSCARWARGEAMRQADAAIVGRLVKVVPRSRFRADYHYRVQRVYK